MPQTRSSVTSINLPAKIVEFLEHAVHSILYERNLYPPECFKRANAYDVPVRTVQHPELHKYVHDMVESCRSLMRADQHLKLVMLLHQAAGTIAEPLGGPQPLEAYHFDITVGPTPDMKVDHETWQKLYGQMRQAILMFKVLYATLMPLPSDVTFSFCAYTNELPHGARIAETKDAQMLETNKTWLEMNEHERQRCDMSHARHEGTSTMRLIKQIRTSAVYMDLWLQESSLKMPKSAKNTDS